MLMFDDYLARMTHLQSIQKEMKVAAAKERMNRKFEGFPTSETITFLRPNAEETSEARIRVIYESAMKQVNPEKKYSLSFIVHPDDSLPEGSIVYNFEGRDYLVTSGAKIGGIHEQGVMRRINQNLKWVVNGKLYNCPAVIFATSYTSTTTVETQIITTPSETLKIAVPMNSNTDTITRDVRFLINGSAYKVTRVDDYTDSQIYNLIVKEDFIQESDNLDLGIADYNINDEILIPAISGVDTISYGMVRSFNIINSDDPQSLVLVDSSQVEILSSDNYSITLKLLPSATVGSTLTLIATLADNSTITKIIEIKSLL